MVKKQDTAPLFEDTLKQLETIVTKLEQSDLPLDEALTQFENGVKLAKAGQKQLQQAEQRIQILLSESSDAELSPFLPDNHE